ncbi:Uncharacterized protein Fot_35646 [Forsythia ovata]|uniref:Uncharacterized protein n=1 Tax=Forsythia ovata TaxID=205694 RepID=A0ABD1SM55_9LAMI
MVATGEWRAETRTAGKGPAFVRNATSRWTAGVREREMGAGLARAGRLELGRERWALDWLELGRQTRTVGKESAFAGRQEMGAGLARVRETNEDGWKRACLCWKCLRRKFQLPEMKSGQMKNDCWF